MEQTETKTEAKAEAKTEAKTEAKADARLRRTFVIKRLCEQEGALWVIDDVWL